MLGMARRRDRDGETGVAERTPALGPQNRSQTAILDAAERVFGTHGFDGASMREIAQGAEVAQALLHYHFKTKEALYDAVFERRASTIRTMRQRHLADATGGGEAPPLETVLGILFMPLEDLLGAKRGELRFYVQMLAEVTVSGSERSMGIVRRFYDPSVEHFVQAFRAAVPGLTRERAVWAYLFAIGARMQAHAPSDRAGRLGVEGGPRWPYTLLVPFVAAGIRAVADGAALMDRPDPAAVRPPRKPSLPPSGG